MISSVRFSAMPQPSTQRKSPVFAATTRPAASTVRFGGGHSGFVYATMISGALLMGFGISNITKKHPKLMVRQKSAPQAQSVEKAAVIAGVQKEYQSLSSPDEKVKFLISAVEQNKSISFFESVRSEVSMWAVQEAAKLPQDRQKIKFILAVMDSNPDRVVAGINQDITLSGIQDLMLKHQVKLLIEAQEDCNRLNHDYYSTSDATEKIKFQEKREQSKAAYEKHWQALAKAIENSEKPATEKPDQK